MFCGHKAMIFQMLCHYWGVSARTVSNAYHRFVEIDLNNGGYWRCYDVGGDGEYEETVNESNFEGYHIPNITRRAPYSIYNRPTAPCRDSGIGSFFNGDVAKKYERYDHISSESMVPICKNIMITKLQNPNEYLEPNFINFLSLQSFQYIKDDHHFADLLVRVFDNKRKFEIDIRYGANNKDEDQIWDLDPLFFPMLSIFSQHEDFTEDYVNWLCDLCEKSKRLKYLFVEQLSSYSTEVVNMPCAQRLYKLMSDELPFPQSALKGMEEIDNNSFRKLIFNIAKSLPKSHYLSGLIVNDQVDYHLSETPQENSQLVPENLAIGLPAFICQSTVEKRETCYYKLPFVKQNQDKNERST